MSPAGPAACLGSAGAAVLRSFVGRRANVILPHIAGAGLLLAAYVSLEWLSSIHEYKGVPITPWNPGLGVVFAMIVFRGAGYGVVLFLGALLGEFAVVRTRLDWPLVVAIAVIIAASYSLVGTLIRRRLRIDVALTRLRDVVLLLTVGTAGAALAAALLSALLVVDGEIGLSDMSVTALPLLVGDAIGIAVMTPLTLRLALCTRGGNIRLSPALLPEVLLYILLATAALWIIIGSGSGNGNGFKYFYLLFLPPVAAAVRYGLDGACVGLALTQFALVGLLGFYGYDARAFTEFQTLMFILTATGLVVGVTASERQHAHALMREAEARLKRKEAEAAQAARFSLVSGMASALAHEINQPMTAARALARSAQHLLQTPGADLARAEANLAGLIVQIDHAGGVIRRMRDFIRRGRPQFSTLDIEALLENALVLVRAKASAHAVVIDCAVPDGLPAFQGDQIQLQQVVLNLVRNAIDAIVGAGMDHGHIRISVERQDAPARLEVRVLDNGPGIDADVAARLFDPLVTSKQDGLGLGLPICASILEAHGGRIWLGSREAGATAFRFSLPLDGKP